MGTLAALSLAVSMLFLAAQVRAFASRTIRVWWTSPAKSSADKSLMAHVAVGRTSGDRLAWERGHREVEAVSHVSAAFGEVRPTSRLIARVAVGRTSPDRVAWERGHW